MKLKKLIKFKYYNDTILEIINSINDLSSEEKICKRFLERIFFNFELEKGAIYLKDLNNKKFYFIIGAGVNHETIKVKEIDPYSEGYSIVFNFKTPINFLKISEDDKKDFPFLKNLSRALLLPIIFNDEVIGLLFLGRKGKKIFTDIEENLISVLLDKLAVFLNQQLIYKQLMISQSRLTEAYDELKTIDKVKTSLLHNITHEFRTPLVTIMGYSELLKFEDFGRMNNQQLKAVEVIYKNSKSLKRIIDNLLTFVQISGKMGNFVFKKVNLVKFVKNVINNFEDSNVTIIFTTEADDIFIECDKELLRIVIEQLILNAIKFNKDNNPINIIIDKTDEKAIFKVVDKGMGISKNHLNKIKEEFYKVSYSDNNKSPGIGFGLSISNRIIDIHKFKFILKSELNKGTEVGFEAPLCKD